MSRSARMPLPVLLALTAGPALIIGMTLWFWPRKNETRKNVESEVHP